MQIGKLRKRVTIQEFVESRDEIGGTTQTWQNLSTVWGEVRLIPNFDSREEFIEGANRIVATATHRVVMRYATIGDSLTPGMRLLVDGKTYQIENVGDFDGRGATLTARCKEVVL